MSLESLITQNVGDGGIIMLLLVMSRNQKRAILHMADQIPEVENAEVRQRLTTMPDGSGDD